MPQVTGSGGGAPVLPGRDVEGVPETGRYLDILLAWRKFIFLCVAIVTLLSVLVSFLLPKWYKSTASILPPKEEGIAGMLGVGGSILKGLASGQRNTLLGQKEGTYNYLAILKSRTAMESVVRKFDLIRVYDISDSSMEDAIKELEDNVNFVVSENDDIRIEVEDRDPTRAAAMANYFTDLLNSISLQLGTQEAKNNREFIEKRLRDGEDSLRTADDALRSYQEKSGVVVLPDQNAPTVSAIAELYGLRARKEIELAIARRSATADNPIVRQLEIDLSELDKKLGTYPKSGLDSYRLFRNVVIEQKIVEYLVPMYEQARIDEQKDVPVILVLDKAVPAEKKDRPKRLIIVASSAMSSFLLSILAVLAAERLKQIASVHPSRFASVHHVFRS